MKKNIVEIEGVCRGEHRPFIASFARHLPFYYVPHLVANKQDDNRNVPKEFTTFTAAILENLEKYDWLNNPFLGFYCWHLLLLYVVNDVAGIKFMNK